MAVTRIMAMHLNKGRTIAQCLKDRTDYAKNPDKTKSGELISAFGCDPRPPTRSFSLPSGSTGSLRAGSRKTT